MTRKYFINNDETTKSEWSEVFKKNPDSTAILRISYLPKMYEPPIITTVPISPEKAREIRKNSVLP